MEKRHLKIWSVWGSYSARVAAGLAAARGGDGVEVVIVDASAGGGLREIFRPGGPDETGGAGGSGHGPLPGPVRATGAENVGLLSGAFAVLAGSDPEPVWAFARGLRDLGPSLVVVDLGDGVTPNLLDFLAISTEMVLAVEHGGESVQGGFNLLKDFVYRRISKVFSENPIISDLVTDATDTSRDDCVGSFADLCSRISGADRRSARRALDEVKSYRPALVGVAASSGGAAAAAAAEVLGNAAATYLGIDTQILGAVEPSGAGELARQDPSFRLVAAGLYGEAPAGPGPATPAAPGDGVWTADDRRPAPSGAVEDLPLEVPVEVFGYNDNVKHDGTVFHVQTEVSGGDDPVVETVVYHGGRVFFSRRSRWSEVRDASVVLAGIRDFASRQHNAAKAAVRTDRISFKGYR